MTHGFNFVLKSGVHAMTSYEILWQKLIYTLAINVIYD